MGTLDRVDPPPSAHSGGRGHGGGGGGGGGGTTVGVGISGSNPSGSGGSERDWKYEAVVRLRKDLSTGMEVDWGMVHRKAVGLLEQLSKETDKDLRMEVTTLAEICAAQKNASEMRMLEAVLSLLRAKNSLAAMDRANKNGKDRRVGALHNLLGATRGKVSLYFMPGLVPDAVGFCGRTRCADCAAGSARVNPSSTRDFVPPLPAPSAARVVPKDLLDNFVSRNPLVDVVIVLHHGLTTFNRHGFLSPEDLFTLKTGTERKPKEDGLSLWPALVVRPSKSAERVRLLWPSVVSFLCLVEKQMSVEAGRKLRDDKLGVVLYASRLEERHFAVAIVHQNDAKQFPADCDDQVPNFLGAVRSLVCAYEERQGLLDARSSTTGWLRSLVHHLRG